MLQYKLGQKTLGVTTYRAVDVRFLKVYECYAVTQSQQNLEDFESYSIKTADCTSRVEAAFVS